MANKGITAQVRRYLTDRPGVDVYLGELETACPGLTRDQIQAAINNRKTAGDPIRTVLSGQCWRWAPSESNEAPKIAPKSERTEPRPDLMMVRRIGTLESGKVVLQDTEEPFLVYLAERLGA